MTYKKSSTTFFRQLFSALLLFLFIILNNTVLKAKVPAGTFVETDPPEWVTNANIYEVNLRQFTPEGTIKAFIPHMQRLKEMVVDILWIMPVHPIGLENRKGPLGSYYSIKDYRAINPEFGTMKDFRKMVKTAHSLGMKVIIDWVANHSAWDNPLVKKHPEWYSKDEKGNLKSPYDWTDVVQFDYSNQKLRMYMWKSLEFWVKKADIDGYRCDVADMVPVDFWDEARRRLDIIKPVFMLAEAENPALLDDAFDMDYAWNFHRLSNEIAKGAKDCNDIDKYFSDLKSKYKDDAIKMNFTSNHDENSWQGTEYERYGNGAKAMAVLMATVTGMPLIYSGQESALNKRLKFFEKDPINWGNFSLAGFYSELLDLKHRNKSLWNGPAGGELIRVKTGADANVYAFVREKDGQKIFVVLNLSPNSHKVKFTGEEYPDQYRELFTGEEKTITTQTVMDLEPWSYYVFEKIQ